ncbi:MAG: toprim domain-containing protein, partial [Ruminococcus sp.]|nr:toprim domain-containing protein [Ruminococcus sp.]
YVSNRRFWYWNSRGKRINALDYLMEIRGYGFTEAVTRLTGEAVPRASPIHPQEQTKPRRPAKLFLPWPRKCATGLFIYLRKRGISAGVIERCISLGLLYQGSYKPKKDEPKYIPVCVFTGTDEAGKVRFACMRGLYDNLKKDVYGSDKAYSFCLPPEKAHSSQVAVFEAPIDALSHATMQELDGWQWNGYRLSLGGTSPVALIAFLERHPEIRRVTLHMDNDLGGLKNARKIRDMLRADPKYKHIRVGINPPHQGKDYNEMLQIKLQQIVQGKPRHREKRVAVSI